MGKNKLFGQIKDVRWLKKFVLSKEREKNIKSTFDVSVNFVYSRNISELGLLIKNFQRNKKFDDDDNKNVIGESNKYNRFIVMDDISGLADKSNDFESFLTVSRKFNFSVVYVFHTMYPSKQNWHITISQTKIFNIFAVLVQIATISRILRSNCKRYTFDYIPTRELWLNRLYFEISNSNKKSCLTIACRNFNSLGPSKFRTNAESATEHICYYNRNKKDKSFNRFLARRKQSTGESIIFEIKNIIEQTKPGDFAYCDINNELEEFNDGRVNDNRANLKRTISEFSSTNNRREEFIRKKPRFLSR